AIEAFGKVNPKSEYGPISRYFIGWCLYDPNNPRRDLKRAIDAFQKVVARYPKSDEAARSLLAIGRCYEEMEQLDKAVQMYSTLVERYPKSPHIEAALLAMGMALHKQGKNAEAISVFDRILNDKRGRYTDDTKISALLNKAESLYDLGRYAQAAETYLKMALVYDRIDPDDALIALVRAGNCYEKLQRWEDAKTWYRRAVQQYSKHPKKRSSWSKTLKHARDRLRALENLSSSSPR
ncbi:TPA: tetratricopeptide repeat protein, partial [Candidatus Poribacteria bacterium]|nr:tetratricopeptide repeat protein [Candidatus Poribacteria bacterium]HEX28628.1 tetratricopeptide repeat protein [Candidatus Poribacteria bacterium]